MRANYFINRPHNRYVEFYDIDEYLIAKANWQRLEIFNKQLNLLYEKDYNTSPSINFSIDKQIISIYSSDSIDFYNLDTMTEISSVSAKSRYLSNLTFNDKYITGNCYGSKYSYVWYMKNGNCKKRIEQSVNYPLALTEDNFLYLIEDYNTLNNIKILSLDTLEIVEEIQIPNFSRYGHNYYPTNEKKLLCDKYVLFTSNKHLYLLDVLTKEIIDLFDIETSYNYIKTSGNNVVLNLSGNYKVVNLENFTMYDLNIPYKISNWHNLAVDNIKNKITYMTSNDTRYPNVIMRSDLIKSNEVSLK